MFSFIYFGIPPEARTTRPFLVSLFTVYDHRKRPRSYSSSVLQGSNFQSPRASYNLKKTLARPGKKKKPVLSFNKTHDDLLLLTHTHVPSTWSLFLYFYQTDRVAFLYFRFTCCSAAIIVFVVSARGKRDTSVGRIAHRAVVAAGG